MTIEEMKKIWNKMDESIEHQPKLNKYLIMEMTKEKYHHKIKSISEKEKAGAIICLIISIYLLFILKNQDTWYLIACNIISLAYYLILPTLSLLAIHQLNTLNFKDVSLKTAMAEFHRRKSNFLRIQQIGIVMGVFILFMFLPPVIKSIDNKDIFIDRSIWLWYVPMTIIMLGIFARWGYRYYRNVIESAGNILAEFES